MIGVGGIVDSKGESISIWLTEFLTKQHDVATKLALSGARERHVFIPVTLGGAPWPVESYLTSDFVGLPLEGPQLPGGVDQVWVVSTVAGRGLRWQLSGWTLFRARGDGIDSDDSV